MERSERWQQLGFSQRVGVVEFVLVLPHVVQNTLVEQLVGQGHRPHLWMLVRQLLLWLLHTPTAPNLEQPAGVPVEMDFVVRGLAFLCATGISA